MRLSEKGLVIKEKAVGEHDRLVVVLTASRGVVSAFANGARKMKHKNASSTGLFCYSHFTFFKNKGTYSIDEAEAIEIFFDLRKDIERLALAQYFCEIAICLCPEEEPAEEYLRLMLNALSFLTKNSKPIALLKAVVELRMLCMAGYQPDLVGCEVCGKAEGVVMLSLSEGTIACQGCCGEGRAVPLEPDILAAMRHITYSEFDKVFGFSLPENKLTALSGITEQYLLTQTDRTYKTLDFYKSL